MSLSSDREKSWAQKSPADWLGLVLHDCVLPSHFSQSQFEPVFFLNQVIRDPINFTDNRVVLRNRDFLTFKSGCSGVPFAANGRHRKDCFLHGVLQKGKKGNPAEAGFIERVWLRGFLVPQSINP
jgi:hypothetical protein